MTRLVIYGDGGFGRELLAPLRAVLEGAGPDRPELCFISDSPSAPFFAGAAIKGFDETEADDFFIIAVGDGQVRKKLEGRCLERGLRPYSLFAPSATIGEDVEIGAGAVFCGFTMVTASARIGKQFQCNIYSYVAHDCVIGDYVTFAPRVCCNGNVHIRDGAYIGTGAVIKQGVSDKPLVIGEGAIVGMGAVVTKDVAAGAVVMGNPAKARDQA